MSLRVALAIAFGVVVGVPSLLGAVAITALAGGIPPVHVAPPPVCVSHPASATVINSWIARTAPMSPLIGTAAAMVRIATPAGIDPRLLAAIAFQETSLGTAGLGPLVHNPFGLGPGMTFSSWEDAITMAVSTIAAMAARGAHTIDEIAQMWAPVGAHNDPTNLNANWPRGVSAAFRALGGDPAAVVASPGTHRDICTSTTRNVLS
jgi:hypothetical protein